MCSIFSYDCILIDSYLKIHNKNDMNVNDTLYDYYSDLLILFFINSFKECIEAIVTKYTYILHTTKIDEIDIIIDYLNNGKLYAANQNVYKKIIYTIISLINYYSFYNITISDNIRRITMHMILEIYLKILEFDFIKSDTSMTLYLKQQMGIYR